MPSVTSKIFLGVQFAAWFSLALITWLSWAWFSDSPPPWEKLLTYSALGFAASTILALLFRLTEDWTARWQMVFAFSLTVVAAMSWQAAYNLLELYVFERNNPNFSYWGLFHYGRTSTSQMMVWSGAYWSIFYYSRYSQQKMQAADARAQTQAAKLKLLQNQVNPHFLFNALSGVDTLLLKEDVASAREMISKLSDHMRQTLEREPAPAVSIGTEVERVESYLDIEKIRAGDRLRDEWGLPETLPEVELPNGILLPLVENAVKHGAINSRAGGYVKLSVAETADRLTVRIENDMRDKTSPGFGIGLSNTRERLETFYGGEAQLSAEGQDGTFTVVMSVPKTHGVNSDAD